jgi:integrase
MESLLEDTSLSSQSRRQYVQHLRKALGMMGEDPTSEGLERIVSRCKLLISRLDAAVRTGRMSIHTRLAVLAALKAWLKRVPRVRMEHAADVALVDKAWKSAQVPVNTIKYGNEPTQRQAAGYVPFERIVEVRDTLAKGSFERLLLSFYTHIAPVRRNLGSVEIVTADKEAGNYLLLTRRKQELVLNDFKTAKVYSQSRIRLPQVLVTELKASLAQCPRRYLFVSQKDFKSPYATEQAFGTWANASLLRIFGRPLTLVLLRHAYISSLDFRGMTTQERLRIASDMQHSLAQQDAYAFKGVVHDTERGAQLKVCRCTDAEPGGRPM